MIAIGAMILAVLACAGVYGCLWLIKEIADILKDLVQDQLDARRKL